MPFDSPDLNLGALLEDIRLGKVQLPDFQREWKWDDPRIASLLTTITLGYPVGVVMMLETGGPDVNFAPKPLAGVNGTAVHPPEQLLLDGQQRLTSLYQSLKSQRPVDTLDPRGKKLRRWYLIDIQGALVMRVTVKRRSSRRLRISRCEMTSAGRFEPTTRPSSSNALPVPSR